MTEYNKILEEFFRIEKMWEYSLDVIRDTCKYFWNPQEYFKIVHIAGTNGKGSVAKMTFQMLKDSWKRVWVYTSPHITDIRERFETQDGCISENSFSYYATKILNYKERLSYFEKCVILAFLYFKDESVEYLVLETWMWGRLDATNVVLPVLSVITSIGYDHTEYLWTTLEKISAEKAGIIKESVPVVLYGKNKTIEWIATEKNAKIIFPEKRSVQTNILWKHQISNARIAYEVWIFFWIDESQIRESLLRVSHRGRLDFIKPNILIDGAHNKQWLKGLASFIQKLSQWDSIVYCYTCKKWKIPNEVFQYFPDVIHWSIINSQHNVIEDTQVLKEIFQRQGKKVQILNANETQQHAQKNPKILYVVFGSLYMLWDFYDVDLS